MGRKSLLSKDMMVVNGGTELGRDKGGRYTYGGKVLVQGEADGHS